LKKKKNDEIQEERKIKNVSIAVVLLMNLEVSFAVILLIKLEITNMTMMLLGRKLHGRHQV